MISPLAKRLAAWYSDVTKKVIPNTVITPADWTFPYLPFYINANRDRKLKNMNAAEEIPTKQVKPGRSSRKRGYPMIEPKEKK